MVLSTMTLPIELGSLEVESYVSKGRMSATLPWWDCKMEKREEIKVLRNARCRDFQENGLEEPLLPAKWQRLILRTPPVCKPKAPWERRGVYYPAGANRRFRAEVRIPLWKEKAWVGGISTLAEAMLAVDLLLQFTGRPHLHYDFSSDYVLRPKEHHLDPQAVEEYIESLVQRQHEDHTPNLATLERQRKEFVLCLKKVVEDALFHGGREEVKAPTSSTSASGSSFPDVSETLADVDAPKKLEFILFPKIEDSPYEVALPEASKKFDHNFSSAGPLEYLQRYPGSIEGVPD